MRPDRSFPPRIDRWLLATVIGAAALPLVVAGWLLSRGETDGSLVLVGWGVAMPILVFGLSLPLRYECRADGLHIRSGWMRWDIPYGSMRGAALSRNPLSSPAWSLRRVRIDLASGDFILVSPDDRESFMEELAARCPHLTRTPSGLVARPTAP